MQCLPRAWRHPPLPDFQAHFVSLISQGVEQEQLTLRTQVSETVLSYFFKPISLDNLESIEDGKIIKAHISKPES